MAKEIMTSDDLVPLGVPAAGDGDGDGDDTAQVKAVLGDYAPGTGTGGPDTNKG